jgi:hypothetical protein
MLAIHKTDELRHARLQNAAVRQFRHGAEAGPRI